MTPLLTRIHGAVDESKPPQRIRSEQSIRDYPYIFFSIINHTYVNTFAVIISEILNAVSMVDCKCVQPHKYLRTFFRQTIVRCVKYEENNR